MGIEPPVVDDEADDTLPALLIVEPDNWEALMLFISLSSQWRIGGMGEVLGLDYTAVEAVFRIKRIKSRAELFDALQIMESAALGVFRAKAEAGRKNAK